MQLNFKKIGRTHLYALPKTIIFTTAEASSVSSKMPVLTLDSQKHLKHPSTSQKNDFTAANPYKLMF